MLIDVDAKTYSGFFPSNPNPFISDPFIELNKGKTERVIRLADDGEKPGIGLIAGIKGGMIQSPFSAPFGGFHFRNEIMYISEIDQFITGLQEYIVAQVLQGMEITLPPDIYHSSFNTKSVNAFIRKGFQPALPEITGWVDLNLFQGNFTQKNSREYFRQALRNGLSFDITADAEEKEHIYELIRQNRAKFGRPIFMTFKDILNTSALWPTDFFKVIAKDGTLVASAIFYRSHPEIVYALFWGDNETGRPLRAMDFLAFNLWLYYKELGYKYIDLGVSTEAGIPNEGLLRFKESHEATSSLRYKFSWKNK